MLLAFSLLWWRLGNGPIELDVATPWLAAAIEENFGSQHQVQVGGTQIERDASGRTALRIRDEGGPRLAGQLLIYPVTDYHTPGTPSYQENADGYGLTRNTMRWFWDHYLSDPAEAAQPYASPLRARDFSGLPTALVVTAEYDPLRDEGEHYAEKLRAGGTSCVVSRWHGMNHGFFFWVGLVDKAGEAMAESCAWLRGIFGVGSR